MSNLHRQLAPISSAAWKEIDEQARTTFVQNIAGRRVVDMPDAAGYSFSALGTGHVAVAEEVVDGVRTLRREVLPVVELRVPFTVSREDVDNVDRGATDSDWDPVAEAAAKIARAEDRTVLYGATGVGLDGVVTASSNDPVALPSDLTELPSAVAAAVTTLKLQGVEGPYSLLVSSDLYTGLAEITDHGYPVYKHLTRELADGGIMLAPALDGAVVVSARGGDYELHLGQDLSVGYISHDLDTVSLYLQETMTFRVNTSEAAVALRTV